MKKNRIVDVNNYVGNEEIDNIVERVCESQNYNPLTKKIMNN